MKQHFIKTINGKSEVLDYINRLKQQKNNKESKLKLAKITAYIDFLAKDGLSIGLPYIKHIDGELWELRPLRDRIFFACCHNNKFIILSCFMKQTQKTPRREIARAKRILKDYNESIT